MTAQVEAQAEAKTDPEALESTVKDKRKMRPKIDYVAIGLKVGDVITFRDCVTTATCRAAHGDLPRRGILVAARLSQAHA